MPVSVSLQGSPISSSLRFLGEGQRLPSRDGERDLLKSIRTALRGSGVDLASAHSFLTTSGDGRSQEIELGWNAHTITLSEGGVLKKKWSFTEEGQAIQWACLGWLEQAAPVVYGPSRDPANCASDYDEVLLPYVDLNRGSTFSPFAQAEQKRRVAENVESPVRTVFVFLRSVGKMLLWNGLEYTFGLPFIVRRAWPLYPHGVMLQRVLEPSEMEEAEASGDITLPTIFSITSPYSEPGAVGVTAGIVNGFGDVPPSLEDEEENSTKPLQSVPATEVVVAVMSRGLEAHNDDLVITADVEKHRLTIWRYAYIKPKEYPALPPRKVSAVTRDSNSAVSTQKADPAQPQATKSSGHSRERSPDNLELPPVLTFLGITSTLPTTTTMASLAGEAERPLQWPGAVRGRRNSLTRNDLSVTMDRMVLGGRMETESAFIPVQYGRMKSAHWMEKLHCQQILAEDADSWRDISASLFDHRFDGKQVRSLLAICLRASATLSISSLTYEHDKIKLSHLSQTTAISVAPIRATRDNIHDLLVLKPDGSLLVLMHGLNEVPVHIGPVLCLLTRDGISMDIDDHRSQTQGSCPTPSKRIVSLRDPVRSSVTVVFGDDTKSRVSFDFVPKDSLTMQTLHCLASPLPSDSFFILHRTFIEIWSNRGFRTSEGVEFDSLVAAILKVFDLDEDPKPPPGRTSWESLSRSPSFYRFRDILSLRQLQPPPSSPLDVPLQPERGPHIHLAPILYALHLLGEDLRLQIHRHQSVLKLASLICRIASVIRPEWSDYWKRLCPEAMHCWPSPGTAQIQRLDNRIPVWPPDMSAILYGRISNPDWKVPWYDQLQLETLFETSPSFAFGRLDSLPYLHELASIYVRLAESEQPDVQKRAENAIHYAVQSERGIALNRLPLGVAAPVHEAARTCQLSPPRGWSAAGYNAIGRNDLAAAGSEAPSMVLNEGYRAIKDYIGSSQSRRTINSIVKQSTAFSASETDAVSGVELDMEDFTSVRFGQDRRLEEIARMLCSSSIPTIKVAERPDLNEHDQAREQQHQVVRIAERTLALPYGRALFTFGTVSTVTREAYSIPKLEYAVRLQPQNITAAPEAGKIPQDCLNWGEFHNGVAAALRISRTCSGVESSWIAFNKPSELTPEHAGFLYGLGLVGHLREMLTWHTFGYLTPKHDLTSIGVLLGLSAANVGSGNRHVTKLLAVHTPALLPTPAVDLNLSLVTQAAGLVGVGLLYMGSKNRRMAEVCLNEISRRDLVQPDLSNEHREAYTYAAALAFGMIMLGKGTSIPADLALLSRLRTLIHGDAQSLLGTSSRAPFDINLSSPAATIALGLMFLRTERQDIAEMLTIPDTEVGLHRIQPSFLLVRAIARALITWDSISPTHDWLQTQLPIAIAQAVEARWQGKAADDTFELAYYNILAGSCFAIGLKYAGTAQQEAYLMIIKYFDMFSRLVYSNSTSFGQKIKRAAIREGLNLISISLSMVMAGTAEPTCFRRLRYAYGMYLSAYRYGVHIATHLSLGLLFLGGGRYTLGTSDAAIACMVTAFFPRSHHVSSDNKSYLQALRHLWVLAVEPRCLIARDVDTTEVVYLPVKITTQDGSDIGTTQLIAPTLIPDLDKILSIRVDTPRYWPFFLDIEKNTSQKESLLRNQTLHVKRRTAFLSYAEDPRGSRSLFVRSGSSTGDAATLDFPQLTGAPGHPASDLSQFISSFSNNVLFLAFADHFCRESGGAGQERLFHRYCHAALVDSLLQDKPQTLQQHLVLYYCRTMSSQSSYFHLRLQDLRFGADFYSKVYDPLFSGRVDNNTRVPLIRENTILGALQALDERLEAIRLRPDFILAFGEYARGEVVQVSDAVSREMAWYLLRNGVPVSTVLVILRGLARDAHMQCLGASPPEGTMDAFTLDQGIKEVLHAAGTKMSTAMGSGWLVRSLDEVIEVWKQ